MRSLPVRRVAKLQLSSFSAVRSSYCQRARLFSAGKNKWDIEAISDLPHKLVNELHSVWAPFALCEDFLPGTFTCLDQQLFESEDLKSTTHFIDSEEIAELQMARIVKPTAKGVIEINPDLLDEFTLRNIGYACQYHGIAPWLNVELRPNGLTIDSTGGATFTPERSSDDFIGTLLVNFNVDYTGGEVEVTYKDRTVVFGKKQCWVAVHKDCSYKIKPIMSGERVDMVFDVYSYDRYAAFDAVNYGNKHHPYCLDISPEKEKCIVNAVHAELQQYSTVVVNLAGHYNTHHTTSTNTTDALATILPHQLTSADNTQHTLLSKHFIVSIEQIELKCALDEDTYRMTVTDANYITNTSNHTNTTDKPTSNIDTKIVLSNRFHPDNLVWQSPFSLAGSEEDVCPSKELLYHTLALVVRKRP